MRMFDNVKEKVSGFRSGNDDIDDIEFDDGLGEELMYKPESKGKKNKDTEGSWFNVIILFSILGMITLCAFGSRSDDRKLSERIAVLESKVNACSQEHKDIYLNSMQEENETTGYDEDDAAFIYNEKKKKPIDESSVYYGLTYKDLWDDESFDDEVLALLEGITKIHYGTAGSSLQLMGRGANFVSIAKRGEGAWQNISAHLDTMTPAELDYLSFRLIDSYYYAVEIVKGEKIVQELADIGFSPELYDGCTETDLARFLGYMIRLFDEKGVNYEWETYDIRSLFR